MPPASEQYKGPNRSWMRPAMTKVSAKTITATVNTRDVSARFHPNCDSRGATNTLHAYSVPNATFIESAPATRHQRLRPGCRFDFMLSSGAVRVLGIYL